MDTIYRKHMADIDKDLQKTIDDHLKRIQDRYKANTKVFTATHIGHIALSVVFLFSILFPFLYLQIDKSITASEIKRITQDINQQEQRIATYAQAKNGLEELFMAVENTPKPLKGYIEALQAEAAGGPVARLPDGLEADPSPCGSTDNKDPWMACRLKQYMNLRFSQYRQVLEKEIAAPIQRLNIRDFDQWKTDLQAGVQTLITDFDQQLSANPGFWKNFDENAPLYKRMVERTKRFWNDNRFEEIGHKMEQAATERQEAVEKLNQRQEQNKKREEELNKTFKNIKTRFGKFGFEVSDAILVAPIVFAALFLVAVLNLGESIRLRKTFHRLFQVKDPQKAVITDDQIALAMPLWVDPLDPRQKQKLRMTVLMIPVLVSVLALLVIMLCWSIPDAFPGLTTVAYWKYLLYYLVAAGFFIHGYRRIRTEIEAYDDQQKESEGDNRE